MKYTSKTYADGVTAIYKDNKFLCETHGSKDAELILDALRKADITPAARGYSQGRRDEGCVHDWTFIGHQFNGHKECTKCGAQGEYN